MKKDYYGITILSLLIALPIISIGLSIFNVLKKNKPKPPEKSEFYEPEIIAKPPEIEPITPIIETIEPEK